MHINSVNQQTAEAFAERLTNMLNESALTLMISIGHRTALFDTMAVLPPATSGQIAEAAGLEERYVREWLGAMTVGRMIEYDPVSHTYWLPPEHAMWLITAAGSDNLARYMQYFPLLGEVEPAIVNSFRNGGGVPYSAYPRFQEVMADDSNYAVAAVLIDKILPLVPGLTAQLEAGAELLDVGCGRGRAINVMAQTFPNSRFTGYDFSDEGIAAARAEAQAWDLSNVNFQVKDISLLDEIGHYDAITAFDVIHDQAHPARVLRNIHAALRPGGLFLMQDIAASSHLHQNMDLPIGPLLYTISTMHCMTVSLAEGGAGLGTVWGRETAQAMLAEAGFTVADISQLPHDIFNDYYLCVRE